MQTANSRSMLWETPIIDAQKPTLLKPGETFEAPFIEYEIKESGLHALSCSVSYFLPVPYSQQQQQEDGQDHQERLSRSFRKVYRFQVFFI